MDAGGVELQLLLATALTIGIVHTLIGPDHYLPFVLLARDKGWSRSRTLGVTALCGVGHCLGSVTIGTIGIAAGLALGGLEAFEAGRGNLAAWALLAFGLTYAAYSLRQKRRGIVHTHPHVHTDGTVHTHRHDHTQTHSHAHANRANGPLYASLFVIFVLGPCEALIPMLMYPAAKASIAGVVAVTLVFSIATVATMLIAVAVLTAGAARLSRVPSGADAGIFSGLLIGACGAAMLLGV